MSDESLNSPIRILVLAEQIPDRLMAYLDKVGAELIEKAEAENYEQIDFIICENEIDGKQISKDYLVEKNEIKLVALSPVKDLKTFLLSNGRLVLDQELMNLSHLESILDRFFLEKQNLHLDESFPDIFEHTKDFKITNHLALGNQIDEICIDAFDKDFNIATIRTFLDHVIYYFTYLKQAGLAGVPYEIEYGAGEEVFGLTIHASMKNFVAEYLVDCFGSVNSKDPLQFLLGVAYRSCDLFEITYIDEPAKLVITGAWTKSSSNAMHGLSFNNVKTTAQSLRQVERDLESFTEEYQEVEGKELDLDNKKYDNKSKRLPGNILEMVISPDEDSILNKKPEKTSELIAFVVAEYEVRQPDESINDLDEDELNDILDAFPDDDLKEEITAGDQKHLLERIQKQNITKAYDEEIQRVRGSLEDDDDYKEELSDSLNEEVAQRVTGAIDAETLNKILGSKDEEVPITIVKGTKDEADDFSQTISGMEKDEKGAFVQRVSASMNAESDKWINKIGTSPADEKKGMFNNLISSAISNVATDKKTSKSMKQYMAKTAPDMIEKNLDRYAEKMGQTLETLNETQIKEFVSNEIPTLMEDLLSSEKHIDEFKDVLASGDEFEIIDYEKMNKTKKTPEVEAKFKAKLEKKLADLDFIDVLDNKYVVTDSSVENEQVQQIISSTMKETFSEEYALGKANREEIEKTEKKLIADLSITLDMKEEAISEIVKGATKEIKEKELEKVVQNIFKEAPSEDKEDAIEQIKQITGKEPEEEVKKEIIKGTTDNVGEDKTPMDKGNSFEKAAMLAKLKQAEKELSKTQKVNEALKTKIMAQEETQKISKEIEKKAKEEAEIQIVKESKELPEAEVKKIKEEEKLIEQTKELVEVVKSGEELKPEERTAIEQALIREKEMLQMAKTIEMKMKKAAIEASQKENSFKSEIERSNRALKAKDSVLDKAKEMMKVAVTKKDNEVKEYKRQLEVSNRRLADDQTANLKKANNELMKKAENSLRQSEIYKSKLESMAKQASKGKSQDNSQKLIEEARTLARTKTALENKLNSETKNSRSLEDRLKKAKELEVKMRSDVGSMRKENEAIVNEMKVLKDQTNRSHNSAQKDLQAELSGKEKEFMMQMEKAKQINTNLAVKIKELETKAADAAKSGSKEPVVPQGVKEKQLDAANKKLQAQLAKSAEILAEQKKDAVKNRGEVTKLENKIKAMERDLAKHNKDGKGGKKAA